MLVVLFLLGWMVGLITELQRSDLLSLEKLLHLPLSLSGIFTLNYLSSLFTLSVVLLVPLLIGLSIAMVIVKGPLMLLLFPLGLGFVFMVTAVSPPMSTPISMVVEQLNIFSFPFLNSVSRCDNFAPAIWAECSALRK